MRELKVLRVFEGFNSEFIYGIIRAPSKVEEYRRYLYSYYVLYEYTGSTRNYTM